MTASTRPVPVFDIGIPQGAQFVQPIQVLTNGVVVALPATTTAKMQIRSSRNSATVLAELTTENGQLTVDYTSALVTINLPSAVSAAFTFERGVYDIDLIYPGATPEHDRIVEGKVYVFQRVTQ